MNLSCLSRDNKLELFVQSCVRILFHAQINQHCLWPNRVLTLCVAFSELLQTSGI